MTIAVPRAEVDAEPQVQIPYRIGQLENDAKEQSQAVIEIA